MRVLVADDDHTTRTALSTLLRKRGYRVVTADDGHQAYKLLSAPDSPALAIIDWMMPGLSGIELCRKLRESDGATYTYIVMLSGRHEKQDFIAGLEAGADDYVSKPFDIDELHARIRAGQRVLATHEDLRMRAAQDELTGVLNRGGISDLMRRELALASREGSPVSVILTDVDNFKQVNDTYGHQTGDAVLREICSRLRRSIRACDEVGRFGGEEFLIVLPGCGITDALPIAELVRSSVAAAPVSAPSGPLAVTLSLGVATTENGSLDANALLHSADTALYQAKRGGRNRVQSAAASGTTSRPMSSSE